MSLRSLHQKIGLGTVQLGLNYGISNTHGKPDEVTAFRILTAAAENHISFLDSADAYGTSLEVIGHFLKTNPDVPFYLISKFVGNGDPVSLSVRKTLQSTGLNSLYAFLYHRYDDYLSGQYTKQLATEKLTGSVKKIGLSIYTEDQLAQAAVDDAIDLIQLPFNPFDASPKKKELMKKAQANGKEIHVRSVFLQGLFFKDPAALAGNLVHLREPLQEFRQKLEKFQLDSRKVLLNYALHRSYVDRVIIGVETVEQLTRNMAMISTDDMEDLFDSIEQIEVKDKNLLNPGNWKF